jgi:indolepyruvate ferredoxin oxidoreductase beta subunit
MAQRGGVVESAVVLGALQSPVVSDGEADILMAFEPLEALRALRKCSRRSLVIVNTSPTSPFTVSSGRDRYPDIAEMMKIVADHVGKLIAFDARSVAQEAGSDLGVNMVMLGTLMRHGKLPFGKEMVERVLESKTRKTYLEMNRRALELGFQVG